ncbi:hypothetical protein [Clostridium thermarum]|uniref:hypothetical protein n=1 Tax=Clostridium thermarum TaxID=1716543 RepID=UPI0013D18437|nr:hypothetical protein [Clostridium thermarum]
MAVVLILSGITIIIFSLYSLLKEAKGPKGSNFQDILEDSTHSMDDTKMLIGEMRREFAETILELQQEIIRLKEGNSVVEEQITDSESEEAQDLKDMGGERETANSYNNVKINDIEKLLKEGYSIDEISEKLEINKGEILLIKDLYLK